MRTREGGGGEEEEGDAAAAAAAEDSDDDETTCAIFADFVSTATVPPTVHAVARRHAGRDPSSTASEWYLTTRKGGGGGEGGREAFSSAFPSSAFPSSGSRGTPAKSGLEPLCATRLRRPWTGSGAGSTAPPQACARACIPRQTPRIGGNAEEEAASLPSLETAAASASSGAQTPTSLGTRGVPGPGEMTMPSHSLSRIRDLSSGQGTASLWSTSGCAVDGGEREKEKEREEGR